MRGIVTVAVNELSNLVRSKLILLIGAVYTVLLVKSLMGMHVPGDEAYYSQSLYYYNMIGGVDSNYYTAVLLNSIGWVLKYYGAFFGIVLGVYTVAIERYGNTLNNLMVKPLYRDTIINGKLLGCTLFILAVFTLTILTYTGYVIISWGNAFSPLAEGYFIRLPIISAVSLVYVLFFFALSMLISLIVSDLAYALIMSMIIKFFLVDALSSEISGKLVTLIGGHFANNPFHDILPDGIMRDIYKAPGQANNILDPSAGLLSPLSEALPDIAKLVVYVVIQALVCRSSHCTRRARHKCDNDS